MKKLIALIVCLFLTSCEQAYSTTSETTVIERNYRVQKLTLNSPSTTEDKELKAIWVSQFDMHPIYRDKGRQRTESDYHEMVNIMFDNLTRDGFNTIFLQVRPNGDSMFESEIYPTSKYIAGQYGGELEYDAIKIFTEIAKEKKISIHAWINPFRLCSEDELNSYGRGILYDWYQEGIGKRIELGNDGILYLDPAYSEATELIVSGVNEILRKYNFDGIHIDDYFYPTEFEFNDDTEFYESGFSEKSEFRIANINRTVKAIYNEVHQHSGKIFGVSPAGNIYSLKKGWYVDIYKWLSEDGYLDYVIPQLYFGFDNAVCPFEGVLNDWIDAKSNENINIYIGLSAAKCVLGSEGKPDLYAGANGKYEWRDNKNILARSIKVIRRSNAFGFCIFSYSSLYDPLSGEVNEKCFDEWKCLIEII